MLILESCATINGVDFSIISRAKDICSMLARGEDLVMSCSKLSFNEWKQYEEAVSFSHHAEISSLFINVANDRYQIPPRGLLRFIIPTKNEGIIVNLCQYTWIIRQQRRYVRRRPFVIDTNAQNFHTESISLL